MRPRLVHPVEVKLFRRSPSEMDDIFNEPKAQLQFSPPTTLMGQVSYNTRDKAVPTGKGNDPATAGHVTCYADEWSGAVGDELELPGGTRVQIIECRPAAHYGGNYSLVKLYFASGGSS